MKALYYQHNIGVMSSCVKRVMKATKGGGQMSSNDTLFAYIRFGGVKTVQEEN